MEERRLSVFCERLRELRGTKSQEEFAKFLDVSRPTVGSYENGTRIPDAVILKNIAVRCKVSTDWLLGLSQYRLDEGRNLNQEQLGLDTDSVQVLSEMKTDGIKEREQMLNLLISSCSLQTLLEICCELEASLKEIRFRWFTEQRQLEENAQYYEETEKYWNDFQREISEIYHRYGRGKCMTLSEEETFEYLMHTASKRILDILADLTGSNSFEKAKKEYFNLINRYGKMEECEYKEALKRIWQKEGVVDGNNPEAR